MASPDDAVGWIVALGFCYFAYRIIFGTSSSTSASTTTTSVGGNNRRSNVAQSSIDQVTNMFPGIPSRNVRYALEQSRGNVQSVVERVLRDGSLPEPPASFFPELSPASRPTRPATPLGSGGATPATAGSSNPSTRPATPLSLITRLGLQDQIKNDNDDDSPKSSSIDVKGKGRAQGESTLQDNATAGAGEAAGAKVSGWQTSAQAREQSLRERKAKMVLEARRKLLEKERKRTETSQAATGQNSLG
ncbi:hypothetical protein ACM66B_005640 [Microbotryomycetes sp. NB124-2]